MDINIIYEDTDLLAVNKPAGIVTFPEGPSFAKATDGQADKTLIDLLIEQKPELTRAGEAPRYGCVHRLDKDTSGILLVAKTAEALIFFQKQFKNRGVEKKYLCLVEGVIKEDNGRIETFLARSPNDPRKQTVYREETRAPESARKALTSFTVLQRFNAFTLVEARIETGRKHQIRAQFASLQHPLAGDKLYRFKNSPEVPGLNRQFLHATYLKIQLPSGEMKELNSPLPEDLKTVLETL